MQKPTWDQGVLALAGDQGNQFLHKQEVLHLVIPGVGQEIILLGIEI